MYTWSYCYKLELVINIRIFTSIRILLCFKTNQRYIQMNMLSFSQRFRNASNSSISDQLMKRVEYNNNSYHSRCVVILNILHTYI